MERCRCFKVGKNQQERLSPASMVAGQVPALLVYFMEAEFGLCHLRIPTWAPFRLQFCCNGRHWLERQMKAAGITFQKADNCFTHIGDFPAAQALCQKFEPRRLHHRLEALAARWVAMHERFGASLRWSVYQAERSSDIVFKKNSPVLAQLYREIGRTAAIEVGCADIYRFMGKKLRANSKAEAASWLQTLVQGTRLKHSLGSTCLKMYDKAGCVLRIECTTNDVTTFPHRRKVEPRRSAVAGQSQRAEREAAEQSSGRRCARPSTVSARWPRR
jgi:hypothetical protein